MHRHTFSSVCIPKVAAFGGGILDFESTSLNFSLTVTDLVLIYVARDQY